MKQTSIKREDNNIFNLGKMILLMTADLFELTESRQSASKSMNYVTKSYVSLSFAICLQCTTLILEQKGRQNRMNVTIRMTDEQRKIADSYAKCEGLTLSEAIKRAFFEAVEEEYDLTEAKAVSKRIASGEEKTYSLDETERMLGL